MPPALLIACAVLGAACASWIATPLAAALARRVDLVDHPGGRHAHRAPTPLAGMAPVGAALLMCAVLLPADVGLPLLAGGIAMLAVGMIDDRYDLSPLVKLLGQTVAVAIPVLWGLGPATFTLPVLGGLDLGPWRVVAWILWGLVIVNALNLIDGHDGLASGIVVISGVTLVTIAALDGRIAGAVIAAAAVGAAAGFLPRNLPPAQVFLGDGGALGLGFLLAMGSIAGQAKTAAAISLVFPLIVLAAPLLDVTHAIGRRTLRGAAPWRADRGHVHHRLAARGLSPWGVLGVLLGWCTLLSAYAIVMRILPRDGAGGWSAGVTAALAVAGAALLALSLVIIRGRPAAHRHVTGADGDSRGGGARTR